MPVLATTAEPTSDDLQQEQTSVELKDVKDGKNKDFILLLLVKFN